MHLEEKGLECCYTKPDKGFCSEDRFGTLSSEAEEKKEATPKDRTAIHEKNIELPEETSQTGWCKLSTITENVNESSLFVSREELFCAWKKKARNVAT